MRGFGISFVVMVLVACGGAATKEPAPPAKNEPAASPTPVPSPSPPQSDEDQSEEEVRPFSEAAQQAQENVAELESRRAEYAKKLDAAAAQLEAATTQTERDAAKAQLKRALADQQELDAFLADAKVKAERAERKKSRKISKECQLNPLAKVCS